MAAEHISGKAMLAGVMGDPVEHSLSPRLHNRWIAEAGLDAAYIPLHVKAADLASTFRLLPKLGFKGWNLTVPHKEAALALVDEVDASARVIGAVNTVIVRGNGTLFGTNTDAQGFIQNLKAQAGNLAPHKHKAVVLGAGGAARAVIKALIDEGFESIVIINRTEKRAEEIAAVMQGPLAVVAWDEREKALAGAGLLINTTTLGLQGQPSLELFIKTLPVSALVADIVYKPLETQLLKNARAHGCKCITGLGMLIYQAAPGFEAWFGVKPKINSDLEKFLLA